MKWLTLLRIVAEDEGAALEVQCFMDDVPTLEEVRQEALASIASIEKFLSMADEEARVQ